MGCQQLMMMEVENVHFKHPAGSLTRGCFLVETAKLVLAYLLRWPLNKQTVVGM
jgi:hypothetical protein